MKNAIIITGLPFRKQGNQSMMRFVKLFLSQGMRVTLFTSGTDSRGHNVLADDNFTFVSLPSLCNAVYGGLRKIKPLLGKLYRKPAENLQTTNYYLQIRTADVFPPYGAHTIATSLNKWFFFLLTLADNLYVLVRFLLFERKRLHEADVIVGYESTYTFAAMLLCRIFNKVYLNKFQGVVPLKACGRDLKDCARYYPLYYYGINPSDLCLMVNDGTDGAFYARARGCRSIYFEPHGVAVDDYDNHCSTIDLKAYEGKFILFNNASDTRLKRTDRIIRALKYIDPRLKNKFVLITTYHADDLETLKEFARLEGQEQHIVFLDRLNHKESNFILRNADLNVMTNEVSNLGNPVLESVYYRVPVLTIDDGSMDGIITHEKDGFVIPLEEFDEQAGAIISRLISDPAYYESIRKNLAENVSVNTLKTQQQKEFRAIEAAFLNKKKTV